jgi:putative spermidine/putrescine transport system permease protein
MYSSGAHPLSVLCDHNTRERARAPLNAREVARSVRRSRKLRSLRDVLLLAPLLLYLVVTFAAPITLFLYRAVDNRLLHGAFPQTAQALADWQGVGPPGEEAYAGLVADLRAIDDKARLAVLARNLNAVKEGMRGVILKTAGKLPPEPPASWRETLVAIDKRWGEAGIWATLKQETSAVTPTYLLAAVDLRRDTTGEIERVPPERRLYVPLLLRTFEISLEVAVLCLLLGFPTAFVLAALPPRAANLLMICVMLPFWTSLLVRTTAWIILLQGNGPANSLLQLAGIIQQPLELIFNRFGVLIAMVHVLLPYMILPLYSVMKNIPSNYMRAAQSLGADTRTAFLRVYLPQTLPGIAAGLLLVFILALGYYVTPALVGGPGDQMLSYMIAYHVNEVVNWAMASALGALLLAATAILFLVMSRMVALGQLVR